MDPRMLRAISFVGIFIALFLCIYYVLKTHQQGETKWYFLVMAMGILMLLSYQLLGSIKRRK